jgi:hypothetical protein
LPSSPFVAVALQRSWYLFLRDVKAHEPELN